MRAFVVLVSALVLVSVGQNTWGQVQYTLTDLGALTGGTTSLASGINNSGQVVGTFSAGSGNHAFLYSGGTTQVLGTSGGVTSMGYGINNTGQIVGIAFGASSDYAFLYSGGTMQDLGTIPNGYGSEAYNINDSTQVVGQVTVSSGYSHAFLYSGGTMQDLGTLGGTTSSADGINDRGQVVGWAYKSNGSSDAFLYSGGTMQDLNLFGGAASEANSINNEGQIVGIVKNSGNWQAFVDISGKIQILGTLGYQECNANCINDNGLVVGSVYDSTELGHAFLYDNGTMEDLNSLISPSLGWTLEEGYAINDEGQIVGEGVNSKGQTDAFLLTPTPEPSTFALLAAGAVVLLGYGFWRRRKNRLSSRATRPAIFGVDDPTSQDDLPATLPFASQATFLTGSARKAA